MNPATESVLRSFSSHSCLVSILSPSTVNWKHISTAQFFAVQNSQLMSVILQSIRKSYSYCCSRCFRQCWMTGKTSKYVRNLNTHTLAKNRRSKLVCRMQMEGGQLEWKTERRWKVDEWRSRVDVLCISEVRNCKYCTDGMLFALALTPHDMTYWLCPS